MERTIASLPPYLKAYVVTQDEHRYTSRDHASWRYIMRQSRSYFKEHAVPIYLAGLDQTGITIDRIPLVAEMDAKLKRLGWGAVPVCGFIPPAAFLDFQARKILPIASDMRRVEHIAYTPAPDIVHEAAGHAPILADENYANYLTMYAHMAQKAIFCREDLDIYEAIRTLSDVKENPDSTPDIIAAAEAALERANAAVRFVSEANKVARMNWWTVEYGLLGALDRPKIYGAGLLSSVGESQACLLPRVRKVRLSLACVETPYNITEPQPQLFVAEDIPHLVSVLQDLEATLSYRRGGVYGLSQAQGSRTVTTTVFDSGIQISGRLDDYLATGETPEFVRYGSPVQLCYQGTELRQQGTAHHPHGFSTPLGRLKNAADRPLTTLTDDTLTRLGLKVGSRACMELTTGFTINGILTQILRQKGKIILMTWKDVRVTRGDQVYFEPAWGDFDMAIGEKVISVFGGPADRATYDHLETVQTSTSPARTSPFSQAELESFDAYKRVRQKRVALRDKAPDAHTGDEALDYAEAVLTRFPSEWLLILEALEIAITQVRDVISDERQRRINRVMDHLVTDAVSHGEPREWLVRQGLALVSALD